MSDDVRRVIYGTILGFVLVVVSWLLLIYISSCGFTLTCVQAAPLVIRTSVPTLNPVHELKAPVQQPQTEFNACYVSATDLIGAWVSAGSPNGAFPFKDVNENPCEGTFADDVQHLFVENSFWYQGAIGCTSCHNADLLQDKKSGGLDLSSYEGFTSGSNRSYAGAKGTDILGAGNWESSRLYDVLVNQAYVPAGHSKDAPPMAPVYIYAGQHAAPATATATAQPTATAAPPTETPAVTATP